MARIFSKGVMLMSAIPITAFGAAMAVVPTTVEIAPGVRMPYINLGGVHSHPSNYTAWLQFGGTGFDSALMYGDDVQVELGDAIEASKIPRDRLFVTSKVPCCPAPFSSWCNWFDYEYEEVSAFTRAKIDARLLGVEVVDLVLLHWPCSTTEQTIATYRSLEDVVLAGKARTIGISNFNATLIDTLYAAGLRVPPAVNQCGFSIGNHENSKSGSDYDTIAKCRERNITYSAYSPLGGLSGVDVLSNPVVKSVAQRHGKSPVQVALRWITQQGIVVVTASDNANHLQTDLGIFDFSLSGDEMSALRQIGSGVARGSGSLELTSFQV